MIKRGEGYFQNSGGVKKFRGRVWNLDEAMVLVPAHVFSGFQETFHAQTREC